ncbi:MAG: hypothetical protein M1814_004911 [Vezdaea aestivalis]|nr:MAG: hypothetical protein M1814_004911 [Vezdaea aestivalis]
MLLLKGFVLAVSASSAAAGPFSYSKAVHTRDVLTTSSGVDCCAALKKQFGIQVTGKSDSGYFASLYTYWALQEAELSPSCLVAPKSAAEVATIVSILSGFDPSQSVSIQNEIKASLVGAAAPPPNSSTGLKCQFAIRGGGHTPWAGAANIQDGVTVDLGSIKNVTVSSDNRIASVGGGATWANVYGALGAMGLSVPGGRVGTVGVGGLALGGGFSFFAPRYGFVCDNVVNYELVTSSANIINVNETSEPLIFKALKGGSNNFGIVTRFDMKTFEQGKHWGGQIVYPDISVAPAMFKAVEAFNSDDYDQYGSLINTYAYIPQYKLWVVTNNMQYTKPITNAPDFNISTGPPTFEPFTAIQPQLPDNSTLRISNMSDFAGELAAVQPLSKRELFATTTVGNSADLMAEIFNIGNATRESIANTSTIAFFVTFQPLPRLIVERSKAAANNSLGLKPEDGNQLLVLLIVTWTGTGEDKQIDDASKDFIAKVNDAAAKRGLKKDFVYLNYAAKWQNPLKSYGTDNINLLKNVSGTHDSLGTFQNLVPGGFKINSASTA